MNFQNMLGGNTTESLTRMGRSAPGPIPFAAEALCDQSPFCNSTWIDVWLIGSRWSAVYQNALFGLRQKRVLCGMMKWFV